MPHARLQVLLFASVCVCLVYGQTGSEQSSQATVKVSCDVPRPLVLTAEDLSKMVREKVSIVEHGGGAAEYGGVPLREILKRAGVPIGEDLRGKAVASYVVAKARDGYTVVFSLGELASEFGNEAILLADSREGKPLGGNLGPFRLVCPNDKAGARSVRMLQEIEVVRLRK